MSADSLPRQALILAGGLGTRLRPFTEVMPKPMLPVGDRSVLQIQIERLARCGVREIYLAANYKAEMLQDYFRDGSRFGVDLHYSIEDKPLGTCGPLSLLVDKLSSPFIVMNGDILTNIDFTRAYRYHIEKGGLITVVSKMVTFPLSYGNLTARDGLIVEIREKPDIEIEISAGIYVMSPGIMDLIPKNVFYGMDELIRDMLSRGLHVYNYRMEEYWLDIGRMEDYERAQKDIGNLFED